MNRKEWLIKGSMTLLCVAMATWLACAKKDLPHPAIDLTDYARPAPRSGAEPDRSQIIADSTAAPEKNAFSSLMPEPTAIPSPTPRPPEPPNIPEILKRYEIVGIVGNTVFLHNSRTKEEVMLKVGEALSGEERGQKYDIVLQAVDGHKFQATFESLGKTYNKSLQF